MIHGTAALEVALTEEKFVNRMLPNTARDRIEAFRQSVHRKTRNEARQRVSTSVVPLHLSPKS